jgi:hypothetical protein
MPGMGDVLDIYKGRQDAADKLKVMHPQQDKYQQAPWF